MMSLNGALKHRKRGSWRPSSGDRPWARGLQVSSMLNVSDRDGIVPSQRTGIVVNDRDPATLEAGANDLIELLGNVNPANRCRKAAESLIQVRG